MLYISKNTDTIIVPKFRSETATKMVLINQVTKVKSEFEIKDSTTFSPTHYTISKPEGLDSLDNGQYNYIIYYNSVVLASGIVQLGDYKTTDNQYSTDFEIKQYNG